MLCYVMLCALDTSWAHIGAGMWQPLDRLSLWYSRRYLTIVSGVTLQIIGYTYAVKKPLVILKWWLRKVLTRFAPQEYVLLRIVSVIFNSTHVQIPLCLRWQNLLSSFHVRSLFDTRITVIRIILQKLYRQEMTYTRSYTDIIVIATRGFVAPKILMLGWYDFQDLLWRVHQTIDVMDPFLGATN